MENVSETDKFESLKSLQSTIKKLENALSKMTQSGANTTLVKKRLNAVSIGLAILEQVWNHKPHPYTDEDLEEARNVFLNLIPSVESSYMKAKPGSPQKTLLERRLKAFALVFQAMGEIYSKHR
jgi:hypothetical protein